MRELAFALEFEPGCNEVADALSEYPDARIRSLSLHATDDRLWRVDHATGTPDTLDAVEEAFLASEFYADCLATGSCGATQTTEVLDRGDGTLVVYATWERTPRCVSIPHIARNHLGDGLLFETRREGRHYTWRIIHAGTGSVAPFFDELEEAVETCARMELLRTARSSTGDGRPNRQAELPPEQEAALRAAVEHGYYESPRAVDAGELAAHPDIPRSTLSYRLRRAEAHVVNAHVAGGRPADGPSPTL